MATPVAPPSLGESVTEGTVTRSLQQAGDSVAVDQPLLKVSADKVDTLPVTAVGKPYKLALRARATQDAVTEALSGVEGVATVSAAVTDGTIAVSIALDDSHAQRDISTVLNRFAITWKVESA